MQCSAVQVSWSLQIPGVQLTPSQKADGMQVTVVKRDMVMDGIGSRGQGFVCLVYDWFL